MKESVSVRIRIPQQFKKNMKRYNWNKNEIEAAVKVSHTYKETLRRLNIPTAGSNWKTLKRKINEYNIDISHFDPNYIKTHCGKHVNQLITNIPDNVLFSLDSSIKIASIKKEYIRRYFNNNPKCEICGITSWQNKPIVFQIHHIDGDNTNNRLNNLQLLCPNYHSQTDNFCSKNKKKIKKKYFCLNCGKEISKNSKLCPECSHKQRQKQICATKLELDNLIREKSFREIGRIYNISDNTIRKWCKFYQLPFRKRDIIKSPVCAHEVES